MTLVNNNTGAAPQYPTSAPLPQNLPQTQMDWQFFLNQMQSRYPQLPLIPLIDSSGSANQITLTSPYVLQASYAFGTELTFKAANTTTSTTVNLNLNGLGNVPIVLQGGASPPVGSIIAGAIYSVTYDGTDFELVSGAAGASSLLASNNTWTGNNLFTGAATGISSATTGVYVGTDSTAGSVVWVSSAAGTNAKVWEMYADSGGNFVGRVINDAYSASRNWLQVTRTGATVASIVLGNSTDLAPISLVGSVSGYGPTAATQVDMTPDAAAFISTLTGFVSPTTATIHWSRNGNQVTLFIPAIFGTSNATSFVLSLPTEIQPARTQFVCVPAGLSTDNSSLITDCVLNVALTQLQFYHGSSALGWTASGSKGSGGFTFSYLLN